MELIHIKEKNINTIIYLDKEKYYGYKYIGNIIKSIDNLHPFKNFSLSKNYTILPKYQKYEVYLDNETGLKHYFYNNFENYWLLFLNNGYYAINYLNSNHKLTQTKIFNLKNKLIICTFLGLMLALGHTEEDKKITNNTPVLIDDYKPSDIETMINLSITLTEEEKVYLYNEQFITDVLNVVNDSYYEKSKLATCFNNISIISYNDIEHQAQAGYYSLDTPNILYIKEYQEFTEDKKATLAHEFAHLCQTISSYNLITEASADIIAKEYFSPDYKYAYQTQVKLLKKLMEIIGTYPIWYYNFTGDFSKVEENVSPYLTKEEYEHFLNDLTFDYDNKEINRPKYEELDKLLNILYYNIYGIDIEDDEIISLIEKEEKNKELVRYYFNKSFTTNEEYSYYLDYDLGAYETLSYEEAIDRGIISAYTISYTEISNSEAFKIIEDDSYQLNRSIDFKTHDIALYYSKHEKNKYIISGIIDGVKYEECDVDDLVKEGIVDVNYRIIHRKNLTAADYQNHNYKDDEICFIRDRYTILNEDTVDYLVPRKIYLPQVDTRYKYNTKYIKKKKIT